MGFVFFVYGLCVLSLPLLGCYLIVFCLHFVFIWFEFVVAFCGFRIGVVVLMLFGFCVFLDCCVLMLLGVGGCLMIC